MQKEYDSLVKKYESLKKSEDQKNKQINDITFMKQSEESKAYGLVEELKEVERRLKIKEI